MSSYEDNLDSESTSFEELGLESTLLLTLEEEGYQEPTPSVWAAPL